MKNLILFEKFNPNSLLHASTEAKMKYGNDGLYKNASGKNRNPGPTFQAIVIDGLAERGWNVVDWKDCKITAVKDNKEKTVEFKDGNYKNGLNVFSKFK